MNARSCLSILGLASALACGGGGGGYGGSSSTPPATPPPNTVWVGAGAGSYGGIGMAFQPATLTVTAGTTVTFQWLNGPHTVTSYVYNSGQSFPGFPSDSSGSQTYTFNTPGTYYYYCQNHGAQSGTAQATGMAGSIVVN